MLRVLDLFSGIGGFSLGLERTGGFKTVAFCEIEEFPRRVLGKHWPEVPCYHDVRELTAGRLQADGISGVDVICGGFPCQDLSSAGKGAGITGARSGLWSELCRLIGELRPDFAIMENVTNLLAGDRGAWFGRVLGDLAEIGYDAEWHCVPASCVGAPHGRDRVWIIANPTERVRDRILLPSVFYDEGVEQGFKRVWSLVGARRIRSGPPANFGRLRANDGISARVDEIAALGNSVVPKIPEMIGRAILSHLEAA